MKNSIADLAVFGGKPAFEHELHVGRPNIGDRTQLLDRINDLLDRKYLSNGGPFVQEFEARVAALTGARHAIAMCNGTVALEIAIRAAGLRGEVIVPSFTFIATAHALQWQEITPVFCDIDPVTYTLDPQKVEQMITPRTTGIIGVHLWGRPCKIEALKTIARHHQLKLLFDASHAFGCSHNGQMIGSFGDAEIFSFHATKFINTFEGGAVVTNNEELAAKVRLMKNFGFVDYDTVDYIGTNGKMTEVAAAMGLTSLESMTDFIEVNRSNYRHYQNELKAIPGITLFSYDKQEQCNYQYIIIEIDPDKSKLSRDQLQQLLWAENVLARRYFYPACHRMEPYRSYFPHAGLLLPHTEALAKRVLCLPTGTGVHSENISQICRLIRFAVTHADSILEQLA